MRLVLILLTGLAATVGLAAQKPNPCPNGPHTLYSRKAVSLNSGFERIVPPDGQKVLTAKTVEDKKDPDGVHVLYTVEVAGKKFTTQLPGFNAEALWAPDSAAFAVTETGGAAVSAMVRTFSNVTDLGLKKVDLFPAVAKAFGRPVKCEVNVPPNVAVVGWLHGSDRILVAAEFVPVSLCRCMGMFDVYEVSLPDARIEETYSQVEAKNKFWSMLGCELRGADNACAKESSQNAKMPDVAPPDIKPPPSEAPRLFTEPVEIQGTVVAYMWSSHKMMGFEGIYTDVMVVRIDKVLKGEAPGKYVRVDFWGNVYDHLDLQLPEAMFSGQNAWRMVLNLPSAVFPRQPELCQSLSKDTVTMVYDDTGKREEVSAFRNTTETSEQHPPVRDLPCFVVRTNGVKAVQ